MECRGSTECAGISMMFLHFLADDVAANVHATGFKSFLMSFYKGHVLFDLVVCCDKIAIFAVFDKAMTCSSSSLGYAVQKEVIELI